MSDTSLEGSESSYELIDYTENPLYIIFSALLHDDNGNGICYHLERLTKAVEKNTLAIERYTKVKADARKNKNESRH